MGTRSLLFGVCAVLLVIGTHAEMASLVVGTANCLDCSRKNLQAENAFKGLHVVVKCKAINGEYETKTLGHLDNAGAFSIPLAADLLQEDGELKQDCFAQLHSAKSTPCPGQEPSKIVLTSKENGKSTFGASAGTLPFSSATCESALIYDPVYKKELPPLVDKKDLGKLAAIIHKKKELIHKFKKELPPLIHKKEALIHKFKKELPLHPHEKKDLAPIIHKKEALIHKFKKELSTIVHKKEELHHKFKKELPLHPHDEKDLAPIIHKKEEIIHKFKKELSPIVHKKEELHHKFKKELPLHPHDKKDLAPIIHKKEEIIHKFKKEVPTIIHKKEELIHKFKKEIHH